MVTLLIAVVWSAESRAAPAPKGGLALPDGRVAVMGSQRRGGGTDLVMSATADHGRTWRELGTVARDPDPRTDLGDGNAVRLRDGRLLATYRRNHAPKDYAIEVAESRDGGRSWIKQGTVETSLAPGRGLWAPYLFVTDAGEVQCFYDDEATPAAKGLPGHQWITMRRWRKGAWQGPTVVAREPQGLSRDGMATVVSLGKGRLLCVVEAVRADEPHAGVLRAFRSADDGLRWSGPETVYAPKDARFHAFAPSMVRVGGRLVLLFATNEDRPSSPKSGTPPDRMMLDVKSVESRDDGRTWTPPALVYAGTHRNYLPSVVALPKGRLLATFLDFDRGPRALEGRSRPKINLSGRTTAARRPVAFPTFPASPRASARPRRPWRGLRANSG